MKVVTPKYVFFFLLFYFSISIRAQFSFQANAETGIYNSKGNFLIEKTGLFTGLEGKAAYKYQYKKNSAGIQLKARPEFYGSGNNLTSFKFRASGEFSRREDDFNWGINLTSHFNNISSDLVDINYEIFLVQGNLALFMIENFPLSINSSYAIQKLNSSGKQNLDLFSGEVKIHQGFNLYFKAAYGLYAEKFSIENSISSAASDTVNSNSGFRIGPSAEINYLKDFIFNFQYRFLFHSSQQTEFPSYEQWIRLVAGKIIFDRVSFFLLIDYYLREYKNSPSSENPLPVLYTPLNRENHISFKTGYDITNNFEVYIKSSFFSENLVYKDYKIEGWNIVFGIQYNN